MQTNIRSFTEALREAGEQLMVADPRVCMFGEGVSYPNGADGTTAGLKAKFPNRIFDVPVSENAVTGMTVGAAIGGLRPIMHHGRVEFALFAADQIFTQAGKWNYMFGGNHPVPVVFRIAIGRQWGNGPQHTQSLYGLFGSALGVKVVIPSSPKSAKGLLISAVQDPNPVIFLEPRWLYKVRQEVPEGIYTMPLDRADRTRRGRDVTVVAYGDGLHTARRALELVDAIDVELIDLVSINPIDYDSIAASVKKTGKLVCVETANQEFSPSSDVIAALAKRGVAMETPVVVGTPSVPCPTSTALTEEYYPTAVSIANAIRAVCKLKLITKELSFEDLHVAPTTLIV